MFTLNAIVHAVLVPSMMDINNINESNTQTLEERLKRIYYNPKHPAALSSAPVLAKAAKASIPQTQTWLKSQAAYTLHRHARKRYPTRRYFVSDIDEQWQADLADMVDVQQWNRGYRYILTVIDILSRYGWARPVKTKKGTEVAAAFKSIFDADNRIPLRIQTDQGKEFYNRHVRQLFERHNIELFSVKSAYKGALVERWNRTIKSKLWKVFTAKNTKNWVDELQNVVYAYNHHIHRTTKRRPVDITRENANEVWNDLYAKRKSGALPTDIKVGDRVKISKVKSVFEKGYLPNWTEEEFFVDSINTKFYPTSFKLRDYGGEVIDGSFYRYEIQPVIRDEETFLVEKIIRRQRRHGNQIWYLVKWAGYPASMNSWVRKEDVEHLHNQQ
jgi:transposase InsO family protein